MSATTEEPTVPAASDGEDVKALRDQVEAAKAEAERIAQQERQAVDSIAAQKFEAALRREFLSRGAAPNRIGILVQAYRGRFRLDASEGEGKIVSSTDGTRLAAEQDFGRIKDGEVPELFLPEGRPVAAPGTHSFERYKTWRDRLRSVK